MSAATENLHELRKEVLSLPRSTRALIAQELLESLEEENNGVETAWTDEAERRYEEIKSGKVKTIPGEDVLRKVRQRKNDGV